MYTLQTFELFSIIPVGNFDSIPPRTVEKQKEHLRQKLDERE